MVVDSVTSNLVANNRACASLEELNVGMFVAGYQPAFVECGRAFNTLIELAKVVQGLLSCDSLSRDEQ